MPDSLNEMLPRVQQVIRQTKARIFHDDSRSEGKIVSLFEPSAEVKFVHQPFGMDPAQCVLTNRELPGIIAQHHGIAQEVVSRGCCPRSPPRWQSAPDRVSWSVR